MRLPTLKYVDPKKFPGEQKRKWPSVRDVAVVVRQGVMDTFLYVRFCARTYNRTRNQHGVGDVAVVVRQYLVGFERRYKSIQHTPGQF